MPWLDKLVDLLVVILGISIAFGIDNWAEGRKDAQTKQRYLVSLQSDLRKDSLGLQSALTQIHAYQTTLDTLFALTSRRNEEEAEVIAQMMLQLGQTGQFTPEDYTYRALQQTGDISLLDNDSLQIALSRLYDAYQNIEQQQDYLDMIQLEYVVPFYFNYDSRRSFIVDPKIYFQPKLINALFAIRSNANNRERDGEEALHQLTSIQRLIKEELD